MQSFIVLGIIPGTTIQTNLNFWIIVTLVVFLLGSFRYWLSLASQVYRYIIIRQVARTINQIDIISI